MDPDSSSPRIAAEAQRNEAASPVDSVDEHDLGLIVERLAWTPEQRLDANTAFLRFYLSARPEGPMITGDQ